MNLEKGKISKDGLWYNLTLHQEPTELPLSASIHAGEVAQIITTTTSKPWLSLQYYLEILGLG